VENVRYFMPEWDSPGDGAKSIVWSQGVAKLWFQKKNSLLIYRNETIPKWMLDLVQRSDPRYVVERLSKEEQEGKLTLDIQQPKDKSQPIIVTATYIWDGKSPSRQKVLHVDQATRLVTAIEYYHRAADGQFLYDGRQVVRRRAGELHTGEVWRNVDRPDRLDRAADTVPGAQGRWIHRSL